MKKLVLYGVITLALLLSASCSNGQGDSGSSSKTKNDSPAATEDTPSPASSDTVKGSLTFVSGGDITIKAEGETYIATPVIPGEYTYEWYLNDVKQSSETNQCVIDPTNLPVGYYKLLVKATSSTGIIYVTEFEYGIVGELTE